MKGKMRQVLALLLIVSMVVTTIQISPVRAQAAAKANLQTIYDGEGFTVTFKVTSQWSGAFNADVAIKNTGDKVIDNWALGFAMPYEITKIWNGVVKSSENGVYKIKNAGSNQDIAVGECVSFGFSAKAHGELILPSAYDLLCFEEEVSQEALEISFKVTSDWKSAFNGEIQIKNISEVTIEDWKLEFDFDHKIDRFWTAEILKQEGNHYYIKNAGYNANIKPGETITLGFSGNPGSVVTTPINYKLTKISTEPAIEYIELSDGKIEKDYLFRAIYPQLKMDGKSIENVKLADDFDGDGLTLAQEYDYDTNPFLKDSDGDGLDDYVEIYLYGTNPNYWDTDHDEMSDGTEVACGLNPLEKDSDGNGILDNKEVISQPVRLDSYYTYNLSGVGTLPSVTLTGKGDFSRELNAISIDQDRTILDINCLVGTPYEFKHDDELTFESGTLTFTISEDVLVNNQLQDLAIAWYNQDENALELLDTTCNSENQTITADISHFSIYLVVNVPTYLYDMDWENYRSTFFDSFDDQSSLNNWKTYGGNWTIQNGVISVNSGSGFKAVANGINYNDFTYEADMIISSGTGDAGVCFRVTDPALGANLFDGYYLGLYPNKDIVRLYEWPHQDIIKQVSKTIDFNVEYHIKIVTDGSNIKAFVNDMTKPLIEVNDPHHTTGTVGLRTYYTNVSFDNVSVELENDGCWVRLSDSSYVKLDKDPALGDETVDSDGDGIPDIIELKGKYSVLFTDPITYEKKTFDTWSFYSNPAKKDTDGDGIEDIDDLRPSIFDTVVLTDTELVTVFNTGRAWYKIACNSYDYLDNISYMGNLIPKNPIDIHTFLGIKNNVEKNKEQSFNIYELTYIGLVDNEGSKIYLHNKSGELREAIFRRLTNEESKYFKHSGILAWENWKEVPKGTKSGFFKGKVLSEADINFSLKLYYVVDAYTVLNTLVYTGATVIAVIVIVEATPVVLANIQGIIFYVKTFGIVEGLKMYQYLGVNNLPNSVITWVQWELADGDSSLDDILVLGTGSANTTKIYRVVNDVEFQLIKNGGQFEELPQYMSSKWFFANDIEYAKKWAQAYYPDGNYKIILIYAPNELLKGVYYTEKIDLIGPAYCFELDEINNILNSIKK